MSQTSQFLKLPFAHDDPPLRGLRVVEFGQFIAAPAAAQALADLGADVIKVEPPSGDAARAVGWTRDAYSPMFTAYNRSKRSIVLGLRDIHAQLGTGDYWRLRIGIGHPGVKAEVINWVLKKPSAEHRTSIEDCIARCSKAVPELLAGEMDKAMMLIHTSQPQRPKPLRKMEAED